MFALVTFLSVFIPLYCVYQLGSLAGLFSERSGVANVAIEGNMIVGAVVFSIIQQLMVVHFSPLISFATALVLGVILSGLFMMLLAIMTNRYLADHIIAGTALNILAPALMILLYMVLSTNVETGSGSPVWSGNIPPIISDWNWHLTIDGKSNNDFNTMYLVILVITILILFLSNFALNKTKFGLRLKSSGENPYALETAGISVKKTRTTALYIAGMLSSLAGIAFAIKGPFFFTVKGSGFLAIGILIMGQYRIKGTVIGSLLLATFIGTFDTVEILKGTSDLGFIKNVNILKMLPYLIPLVGLIFLRTSYVPKAVGTNFKKDQR